MSSRGEQGSKHAKKGSGSLRKVKAGYEYRITYKDVYGRSCVKSFSGKTIDIVITRANEFINRIERLKGTFDITTTMPEILHWKIDRDYAKNYTGEAGYGRNLYTISIIEQHEIGKIPIAQITPAQVDDFMSSMTSYSNGMLRKIHAMLKTAFRIAFDSRLIETNFMTRDDMRCPKSDKQDRKIRGFTEEEQALFVRALMEHEVPKGRNDYRAQLLISLYSGLRMGEVNALKPKDIDFEHGLIHVRSTVCRGIAYKAFIKDGAKTEAGVREVPISGLLEPVLKKALADRKRNPEGLLFYDYNKNGIIETSQVNSTFRRICDKAGIEHTGQHMLRHTFATRCIEAGVSPLVLKNWLGHTNIHITLDTYSDVFARMNAGSIALLDKYMESIGPVLEAEANLGFLRETVNDSAVIGRTGNTSSGICSPSSGNDEMLRFAECRKKD